MRVEGRTVKNALSQLPSSEEIDALLADKKTTAVVFFLDDTFEELEYDVTTTVVEAVEQLAGLIKLQNYSTFTLYESRKVPAGILPRAGAAGLAVWD